ncbi:MAG: hypothetical protein ACRC52_05400, partial [Aeromonas veronii]
MERSDHPKYLGVTLDRTLSFKRHCNNTKQKFATRNNLNNTHYGVQPALLRTSALALCFSAGEYAAPVWCRSAHCKQVDDACRVITGCLKPTPISKLYPLAGIAPPDIRRDVICAEEMRKATEQPLLSLGYLLVYQLSGRHLVILHRLAMEEVPLSAACRM